MTFPFTPPPLDNTLGAMLLGLVASTLLFGVSICQVYVYFEHFPKDSARIKYTVLLIFTLEALAMALNIHYIYHYGITNFSNFIALLEAVWSTRVADLFGNVLISLIQTLYCFRLWRLADGNKIIPVFVSVAICASWAASLFGGIKAMTQTTVLNVTVKGKYVIYFPLAVWGGVDIILSGSLCYYLQRSRSGFAQTNSLVTRLIFYISSTGILTSIWALTVLITYATMPDNLIWCGLDTVITHIYVNSYLVVLNARHTLRERSTNGDVVHLGAMGSHGSSGRVGPSLPTMVVDISQDKTYQSDAEEFMA